MSRAQVATGLRAQNIFIYGAVKAAVLVPTLQWREVEVHGEHTACRHSAWTFLCLRAGTVPVPPKRCIKGKITHKKWAEKCSSSTASPGLKLVHPLCVWARQIVPCRAYKAWKNPSAIGLGAISH